MTTDAPALTDGQEWSQVIQSCATPDGVQAVIKAANVELAAQHSNNADLIVACALMLAHVITRCGGRRSIQKRQGILTMIDNYAMICAIGEDP